MNTTAYKGAPFADFRSLEVRLPGGKVCGMVVRKKPLADTKT